MTTDERIFHGSHQTSVHSTHTDYVIYTLSCKLLKYMLKYNKRNATNASYKSTSKLRTVHGDRCETASHL